MWIGVGSEAVEEVAVVFGLVGGGDAALAGGSPPHESGVGEGGP